MNKIINIGWSIGNYCNAKCKHCYSWKTRKTRNDILTKEEVDIIIDKLIAYEVKTINFGGNEPIFTQGPDASKTLLPYIINRFSDAGIICGITTNGFTACYLHDNFFDVFMKVNDWDFSLDSPCEEEHNNSRNTDAFENVIRGFELCSKYDRPKSMAICGMNWNLNKDTLDKFLNLALKYNTEIRINILKPIEKHHFDLLPSVQQVYEQFEYLLNNTELVTLSEPVFACQVGNNACGCNCGINSFRIRSKVNGTVPVTPCVYLDLDGGDILKDSLEDIIKSDVFNKFNERRTKIPRKCHEINCDKLDQCRGGCAARTILMTGDLDNPDPYCPYINYIDSLNELAITINNDDSIVRVHENYLCTWIGKPKSK